MPTSKFDFIVLIVFFRVRWLDLDVFEFLLSIEAVCRDLLRGVQSSAHVDKEFLSERITVKDPEDSLEEVDIHSWVEKLLFILMVKPTTKSSSISIPVLSFIFLSNLYLD